MKKNRLRSSITLAISTLISLLLAEGVLRLKNLDQKNYDIEMWRYAKELKTPSNDEILGHEHIPEKSATLQSVNIRINSHGARGPEYQAIENYRRRILFLGSSITLGWGVSEQNTLTNIIQTRFADHENTLVINGGIGNYNSVRYVRRFLTRMQKLNPTDIVVQYFVNDAESLKVGGGNIILRHSQLAVTLFSVINRYLNPVGLESLVDHYQRVYDKSSAGFIEMKAALRQLDDYADRNQIKMYLVMTPDIHNLHTYKLQFIHDILREFSDYYL